MLFSMPWATYTLASFYCFYSFFHSDTFEPFLYQEINKRRRREKPQRTWIVHTDSDLVLSQLSVQQCKVGGWASNLIMLKRTFPHLLKYISLDTNSDIYAYLSSKVGLISTQKQIDYMDYFPQKSCKFFNVKMLHVLACKDVLFTLD